MSYDRVAMYVMSGTGNTLRVASWMQHVAEQRGISARVMPYDSAEPAAEAGEGLNQLVGLLLPAHAFTAPWAMLRFTARMPRGGGTHAFVAVSRGGSRPFGVRLPGMEGTAGYLVALLLAVKGYRMCGVAGFDMPSNWTSLHPGMKQESIEDIEAHTRPSVERFAEAVLAGRSAFHSLIPLFLGLLLLPISALYLLVGRFALAKLFFANSSCNGCALCAESCPNHAIRMWGGRPYWTFSCESCMRCMAYCPRQAVEAGHSWGVVLYFLMTVPFGAWAMNRLSASVPGLGTLDGEVAQFILQYPYWLVSILLAYAVFTLAIRLKPVNAMFTYTTLTHFYRRYHQRGTRLGDLSRDTETREKSE